MPKQISNELLTWPVELLLIAPPPECEKLSSADWDTLKRNHADKVVKISRRRRGYARRARTDARQRQRRLSKKAALVAAATRSGFLFSNGAELGG